MKKRFRKILSMLCALALLFSCAAAFANEEQAETPEELKAAADALRQVEGHPESMALAEEADLARARLALEANDPEAAREAVASLAETDERRTGLENECLFLEAKAQMGRGEYEDAREAFLLLAGIFPDAAGLASDKRSDAFQLT